MTKKKIKIEKVSVIEFLDILYQEAGCFIDGILDVKPRYETGLTEEEREAFYEKFRDEIANIECAAEGLAESIQNLMQRYAEKYPDKVPDEVKA